MPKVACEIVTLTFDSGEGRVVYTIPAYTRSESDLMSTLANHLSDYVSRSSRSGAGMSVGDFALYLIAQAALEPREI